LAELARSKLLGADILAGAALGVVVCREHPFADDGPIPGPGELLGPAPGAGSRRRDPRRRPHPEAAGAPRKSGGGIDHEHPIPGRKNGSWICWMN
jgi:hypothetical protein